MNWLVIGRFDDSRTDGIEDDEAIIRQFCREWMRVASYTLNSSSGPTRDWDRFRQPVAVS